MKVIEITVPPDNLYIHPESATHSVPAKYLDESKYYQFNYFIHKIQENCRAFVDKNFWDSWGTQINFPMLSEEYIVEYGVDQSTVYVMVFESGYDSLLNPWLELGNSFVTHRELPESDASKYFI